MSKMEITPLLAGSVAEQFIIWPELTIPGARMYFRALLLICCASAATAGPFGLDKGTPLSELNVIRHLQGNAYLIAVPQPLGTFGTYMATVGKEAGLCKLIAVGKPNSNDDYGSQVRAQFDELSTSLSNKYGVSRKNDTISRDSPFVEPNTWAMGVYREDRILASVWDRRVKSTLPEDIGTISLKVDALSMTQTNVILTYEFSNFATCQAETAAAREDAL